MIRKLIKRLEEDRCIVLLLSIFVFLGVFPFLKDVRGGTVASAVMVSVVILSTLYAAVEDKKYVTPLIGLAVVALILEWVSLSIEVPHFWVVSEISNVLFWGWVIGILLVYVLRGASVSLDQLAAAISIYLLLAIAWASVHSAVEHLYPGAYAGLYVAEDGHPVRVGFLYYSFVTLTTLGYGDMTPEEPRSMMLSAMEAVMGVLYVAVMIARLVGDYSRGRKGG